MVIVCKPRPRWSCGKLSLEILRMLPRLSSINLSLRGAQNGSRSLHWYYCYLMATRGKGPSTQAPDWSATCNYRPTTTGALQIARQPPNTFTCYDNRHFIC